MKEATRILIVEDKPADADLAKYTIQKVLNDCEFQVVETRKDFLNALEVFQPDVILSDYSLPRFDGMKALKLTQERTPLIPLIIWTGSISEDVAVECMKAGANNYILKENIKRLGPAVIHALEERQVLLERRQVEEKYQNIIENSLEGIFQSTPQGCYLNVNPAMARLYGYDSPKEMIESVKNIADQIYVDSNKRKEFTSLLASENIVENFEERNYRKDGSIIWTSTSARAVRNTQRKILYYEGFIQDITQRKKVEEILQTNEKRFRALIENGLDDISLLAVDGTLLWESPSIVRNLGYPPDTFVGHNIFELVHPDDQEWTQKLYQKVVQEIGSREQGIFRLRHSDGTWRWMEAIATNMLNEPSVNAIVINYRDITERRQAEDDLRKAQGRIESVLASVADTHILFDKQWRYLYLNEAAVRAMGRPAEEVLGHTLWEIYPDIIGTDLDRQYHRAMDERQIVAFEYYYPADRSWWENHFYPAPEGLAVFATDVTERKQAEERLRQSEDRYRLATKATNDVIWEWNPKTNQLLWSENAQHVFGYLPEEVGPNEKWWDNHIHPDDREWVVPKLNALIDGNGSIWMEEYRFQLSDGSYAYISDRAYIERDENSAPIRMIGAMSDITPRKEAEIERQALLEIMQGLANTTDLQELLELIHHSVAKVIYARNFFVVLYEEEDGIFEEIYSVDEYDPPAPPDKLEKSITSYVFRSGEPLLLTQEGFDELVAEGEVDLVGTHSASWLGVPLKTSGKTIGVIAVQDYENDNRYSERDKEFLASIASQIALAINHSQTVETVRESEERYRLLVENSGEAILVTQPDGAIYSANPEACRIFGRSEDEIRQLGRVGLLDTNDPRLQQALEERRRTGQFKGELNLLRKDGKVFPAELSTTIFMDSRGNERTSMIIRDISERKRADQALHKSEALYRQAIEVAGAVPYYESYYDEGRLIKYEFIGEGIREITGYGPEEFNAKLWDSLVEEVNLVEDLAGYSLEEGILRVRAGENSIWKCEHRLRDREGKIHWVFEAAVELRDENGVSHGSIGTYQDITARKQAEKAEREQRVLAEALRDTAETLSSTLEYGEVLDHILAAAGRVVPHDAATVMLIEGETARVVRSYGYDKRGFDIEVMGIRLPLAETNNLREMLETRQPVIVYDTYSYPSWKRLESTDWLRSNVGAPISIQDQVIGFILLDGQTPGFFTPVHAERLEAFANQAAIAIHNAHLLQQAQEEIAERKRAEEALRAEREKAQKYLDIAGVMMLALDQDGVVTLINQKGCEILGYCADEIIGRNWINTFIPEASREELHGVFQQLIQGNFQSVRYYENVVLTKSGEERLIAWHNTSVHDSEGTIISTLSSGEDITERKQTEDELRASEERFRQLAANIEETFWMTDAESDEEIYISPAAEVIWKRPVEDLLREPNAFLDSVFSEDQPTVLQAIEKEKMGERAEIEYRIVRPDGSVRWVWDRAFPIFDDTGKVKRIAGLTADITERRESEIALIKSQSRYRELFDSSPISIWEEDYSLVKKRIDLLFERGVKDLKEYLFTHPEEVTELASLVKVTDVNKASLELYQVEHKEDLLNSLTQVMGSEPLSHFEEEILGLMSPSKRFVWEGADKTINGTQMEVIVNGSIPDGYEEDWSKVIVSIIDITERRQAERQLRKLSRAVEQSASTIVITDTTGNTEYVNPKFTEITGYSPEEVIGQNPRILKSGSTPPEVYKQLWQAVTSGREWHGELLNRKKNDELFWEYVTISPILNERGEITHFVGVKEDITQRKQSEVEIQRHLTDLEALYENGLAVGRLLKTNEIGNRVINTFARYLQWHHVTIRLRQEESDDLELVAFNLPGLKDEEKVEMERHFATQINKVGQGLSGWAIQTGSPFRTGNVRSHPQYIDIQAGIQSGLYMPLKVGERVIGVISVESEMPNAFTEQDERLLATLANQAAIAFENARLYEAIQKELSERKRAEQALRASEVHYRELADSITDILFELDQDLRYTHWNRASEMFLGIPAEDAIGKLMREVFEASGEQSRREEIYKSVLKERRGRTFETEVLTKGQKRALEINAYPSARGVSVVAKDVTERKQSEIIMQKRFELMEFSAHHSLNELMQKTIDEVSELTDSSFGFLHFVHEDQITLGMQTWSTSALQLFQVPVSQGEHLPLDQAGVWAEAARQRHPLIQNDYESLSKRKGLPQGHVPIRRELVIPIIRNERIMAIMGIANKLQDYTHYDLELAARLADYAWDITERKQMELALQAERNQLAQRVDERTADLSRANSNLARALRVKDEFLANMSHELRTPLNAILGLSESLSEQIAGPLNEKQQKYISTISESGHHLLSLINDILDLAKIDAGQITLDINKVNVRSVCQASLRMIKQLAQKKNQEVSLEIDDGLGLMWADERRLKQILVNLLGNAVKFTPENGKLGLEVHGDEEANKISFTVWDKGLGIKEEDLARLFQPFVQLNSGLAREATGTGLGLALVAQMARLHGGSIQAISEPESGSRFTVVLPWEPALAMDAATRMKITGKFRAIKLDEKHKPSILLVEDTQEVTMMVKDYLELAGYKVVTAQDGVDALVQAKLVRPDLILMDVQMPRMDGLEATRKLRSEPDFRYTPIIALTALAMAGDRERCLEAGMDEYISKPINLKALIKIIQSCLFSNQEIKSR